MERAAYAPISDYALIGDCHGAALVRRGGSIDWACMTRFDAGNVFCRLLDAGKGGSFALVAHDLLRTERRYLPDTNVLETTFVTRTGTARVLDCFAMREGGRERPLHQLLRLIEGQQGTVVFDILIEPRFDYGSLHPWLRYHAKEDVHSAIGGDDGLVLSADCELDLDHEQVAWTSQVTARAGQRVRFALTASNPYKLQLEHVSPEVFDARLDETIRWWERWTRQGHYEGPFRDQLIRSALTLKALTYARTGSIVAAPTTSLPEVIGGERNWDYRFSWVRDSTMTLHALVSVGHTAVASGFKQFVETASAGRAEEVQIMYGCHGERRLTEVTLDYLEGYRGSRPARVGNGAASQTQLDVYGSLLDAAHLWRRAGNPISEDGWHFLRGLVEVTCRRWKEPDRGIWEVRGAPRHFVYSKAMCWLALERGVQAAEEQDLPGDLSRWRRTRDEIRKDIETHGVDPKRGCFVQSYGSKELDASLLRLPMIGFVDANDARMLATVEAVRKELSVGPLLRRYRPEKTSDGLKGGEGAFLMLSFWLVDLLTMQGRIDEAEALLKELLRFGNDLGLFSEEYDLQAQQSLGNFPQAFTHIALIGAVEQLRQARAGGVANQATAERSNGRHPHGGTRHHTASQGSTSDMRGAVPSDRAEEPAGAHPY